jgi:hypothetical protein
MVTKISCQVNIGAQPIEIKGLFLASLMARISLDNHGRFNMNSKNTALLAALAFFVSIPAFSWEGYDYENGEYVEIEKGNLVREGEEIEYYDYEDGEYKYGEVQDVQSLGNGAEVEVYDYESGEYRTFEMED